MDHALLLIKVISFIGAFLWFWVAYGFLTKTTFLTLKPSSKGHRVYLVSVYTAMGVIWTVTGIWV